MEEWLNLLSISTRYMCDRVRALAVNGVAAAHAKLLPVRRIELARRYELPAWERPAIVDLVVRVQPLTVQEATALGMETVARLAEARERFSCLALREEAARALHDHCKGGPSPFHTPMRGSSEGKCAWCRQATEHILRRPAQWPLRGNLSPSEERDLAQAVVRGIFGA